MPTISFTYNSSTGTPHIYSIPTGGGTPVELYPQGVSALAVRPTFVKYKRRVYLAGSYSRPLVFTEFGSMTPAGIQPPTNAPTLAASGTGVTGNAIGYLTFAQKVNDSVLVYESDFSASSNTLALVNQGRAWSNIPTTAVDSRVTHVRGYVSMDGAAPRLAFEVLLGVASFTENVPTAALGPVLDSAGSRGIPPYAKWIIKFHDRVWFAGDPANPHLLRYSELSLPEAVAAVNSISTRDGEAITGIASYKDTLVVFCRKSIYALQGFTETDFELTRVSPTIGCISHFSITNIHDRLWFAGEAGVYVFDGAPTFVMEDLRDYYTTDYSTYRSAYEDSVGCHNRVKQRYELQIQKSALSQKSFYYLGHFANFDPAAASGGDREGQPAWTFKVRTRLDTFIGSLPVASGTLLDSACVGSSDGYIRQEDVTANHDDDSDTYACKVIIRTAHFLYNDPGGGRNHGKAMVDLDIYLLSENNSHTVNVYGGDEDASTAVAAMYTATKTAGAVAGFTKKSVWHHRPTKCSGRGFTVEITATSPNAMEYRGLGGTWKPAGMATRPATA